MSTDSFVVPAQVTNDDQPSSQFDTSPNNLANWEIAKLTRGARGRFLPGNSGGGRPKGSRNKLSSLFVTAVANDFAVHGASALQTVRETDPATYLRIIAAFIPRELVVQREAEPDFDAMSDAEVRQELEQESRRRDLLGMWQRLGR